MSCVLRLLSIVCFDYLRETNISLVYPSVSCLSIVQIFHGQLLEKPMAASLRHLSPFDSSMLVDAHFHVTVLP
jgi:hypothetical protein